jgi:predicted DNA-binding transcriptional regulator AlpA
MKNNRKEQSHQEKQGLGNDSQRIMTVKETAQFMGMSVSWVYKNADALGGRKLGGSLFFPSKEDLYEYLFHQEQRLQVRVRPQGTTIHQSLVQNQDRRQTGGSKKARGVEKPRNSSGGANRHGLLGPG